MEAARPVLTQTPHSQSPQTQSTPSSTTTGLSSKKSPKRYKQNNNNSSPKRYINEPTTSNMYHQNGPVYTAMRSRNDPISIPMRPQYNNIFTSIRPLNDPIHPISTQIRSQNDPTSAPMGSSNEPSNSATRFRGNPFPRRPTNDRLITAIENHLNMPTVTQANGAALPLPTVNSLNITVNSNANPPQRIVQNDATHSVQVESDERLAKPHLFRFPQSRPFEYDTLLQKQRVQNNSAPQPFVRSQQNIMDYENGESSQQPNWRDYRERQRQRNYSDEYDTYKKVIVTGFPAYTKAEELIRKLSCFGQAHIEIMKNRVAVIMFRSEQEAYTALQANDTITVYGTILSILKYTNQRHVMELIRENKRVVRNEHKGAPVAAPTEIDLSGDFGQQIQNIEDAIRLTQEEVENINLLFEDIEKYMRMIFPNCEAVPFGSITTGLGIKSSDADCFLALGPGGAGAGALCSQFVSRAARLLRLHPGVFARLLAIPRANTPIVKFLHVPTNVNCDLNSKTPLGVQNSRLLGHLLQSDPRFGSLALFLKYWARVQQLSGTGRLTNYALLLLLIFYLQRNLLPPVFKLQGPAHSYMVENWEAGFDRAPLPPARAPPPPRDLLGGFFQYYAEFDFDNLAVCPLLGRPLRKSEFESNALPEQYQLYQRNIAEGLALPVRTTCSLCIQDPFELSHNVASAVSSRLTAEIMAHIKMAAAAYKEKEKSPGDFIRTILLARPPELEPCDARAPTRVAFSAKLLLELSDHWQDIVRDVVLNVMFEELLSVKLRRIDSVSKEAEVSLELYHGVMTRPVWKRGGGGGGGGSLQRGGGAGDMAARLRRASAGEPDVLVPFQVEFVFRMKSRGFFINIYPLDGADVETFRSFRTFVYNFAHRWYRELLGPHLKMNPSRTGISAPNPKQSPKKMPPKKQLKKKPTESVRTNRSGPSKPDPPIASVAFVNSNHKDLCESVSAISLTDNSKRDSDAT